ncbi:Two-component sensor histidine kinase, contains HisKA and HATPase domains [Sphingomonas gellani]|uniref:histidine kinase n=1 Tax=Sphingomonas gellani TaxID=1166340 RepID=A0A1H8J7W4_9SPHN|nr:Two-component sensor histidine kinase, contains HisKA and HATPase domains [Sphingomonas gellani]
MALIVTALIRALLVTSLLPYLLFIPVVLLIALLLGKSTGIYATWVSALLAALTLIQTGHAGGLTLTQWGATLLYAIVMTGVSLTAAELRAAFQRSQQLSAELEQANAGLADANRRLSEHDQHLQLINQELGHRLKNQLSIVQAVAGQTLRQSSDMKTASEALGARLAALGRATDMLTASEWRSADLHALAHSAFASRSAVVDRLRIDGPAIRFNPQVAMGLTLALHELMTNATKYGALSNDTGHVDLSWTLNEGPDPNQSRFCLTWRETGGPVVKAPTRRGFGSVMIERSLRSYFRGETSVSYDPAGLVFRIDAPVEAAHFDGK